MRVSIDPVCIVDGYTANLRTERGHLLITDGFPNEGRLQEHKLPRGRNSVQRIVIRASAGSLTIGAVDWCNRMNVPLAFVGSDSRLINCLVPDQPHDGPIKRAQAISGTTDDALRLTRWLLKSKIDSQESALKVDFGRLGIFSNRGPELARAIEELASYKSGLGSDTTLIAFLAREAQTSLSYWKMLIGSPLPWPEWAKRRIPEHWQGVSPRGSGLRDMREATDPFNAMLNYGYTLLEIEGRVACAAFGLDPDLGLLHVDARLRESFIYDLIEPVRAKVDSLTFEFLIKKGGLRPWMFHELRNGVVRLDPDWARDLATYVMPKIRKPVMDVAEAYVKQLRQVRVAYVLEHPLRFFALNAKKQTRFTHCEYCKKPLLKKGLKFCGRECYLRHSIEVRQPIKAAWAKNAEMRAKGIDPSHGGEAARKRALKAALSNRRRTGEKRLRRECGARRVRPRHGGEAAVRRGAKSALSNRGAATTPKP